MEQDLDTTPDWVAVDHFNTGQPHTHVVVRGVTDEGKILYIAGERQTELEVQQKLSREVDHDRFTRLDRTLVNAANVDRQITADAATWLDRQLVGRHPVGTTPVGFGHKVEKALERRNET
jgi:type IV secretory pathway VirD2 relaxase